MDEDNDGRFPDESPVEVRYPRDRREEQGDRSMWPWLPGTIVEQCGPDEWYVRVVARELAVLEDGRPTADEDLFFPCCFRAGAPAAWRGQAGPAVRSCSATRRLRSGPVRQGFANVGATLWQWRRR